jgi:hypothetical protein
VELESGWVEQANYAWLSPLGAEQDLSKTDNP